MSLEDFRTPVSINAHQSWTEITNIVVQGNTLYAVEPGKGIHIVDNTTPEAPQPIGFLPIYDASQITLFNNRLYAKSYMDIVVIDVSAPHNATEVDGVENFFRQSPMPFNETYGYITKGALAEGHGIVVEVTQEYIECSNASHGGCAAGGASSSNDPAPQPTQGTNGSMSAMISVNNHLYVIEDDHLFTLNLQNLEGFNALNQKAINARAETLFSYNGALYIGTQTGVHIYDLNTQTTPTFTSKFEHPWQCDPVVVQGTTAYATLRDGAGCGGNANELNILDVSDLQTPTLISRISLQNPHGLAVDGNTLLVADGATGVKILDVTNKEAPSLITTVDAPYATDVIAIAGWAIAISPEVGLVQLDYSNLEQVKTISTYSQQ